MSRAAALWGRRIKNVKWGNIFPWDLISLCDYCRYFMWDGMTIKCHLVLLFCFAQIQVYLHFIEAKGNHFCFEMFFPFIIDTSPHPTQTNVSFSVCFTILYRITLILEMQVDSWVLTHRAGSHTCRAMYLWSGSQIKVCVVLTTLNSTSLNLDCLPQANS